MWLSVPWRGCSHGCCMGPTRRVITDHLAYLALHATRLCTWRRSVGHGMILQRTHKSCCASQEPELLLAAIVVAFASLVKVVSRPPAQL